VATLKGSAPSLRKEAEPTFRKQGVELGLLFFPLTDV